MVTASEALAAAAAQVGYHVMTFVTFPSQIMGGPTWSQCRIAVTPALSNGDTLDVLVAFNESAFEEHRGELRDGGILVYDSAVFEIDEDDRTNMNVVALPYEELGKSTGNPRAANMVILGAIAKFVEWPEQYLEDFNVAAIHPRPPQRCRGCSSQQHGAWAWPRRRSGTADSPWASLRRPPRRIMSRLSSRAMRALRSAQSPAA